VLVATEKKIQEEPGAVAAGIKAVVKAQKALKENPSRATGIGKRLFPATEAGLIATLIERDLPFYDPAISEETVEGVNQFARAVGLLSKSVAYDQVVATRFRNLWKD